MRSLFFILLIILVGSLPAQNNLPAADAAPPHRSSAILSIKPVYQSWSLETDGNRTNYSQTGTLFFFRLPISSAGAISLQGARAQTGGDPAEISGFTDVKISGQWRFPALQSVMFVNVNLPSGKTELTREQFATSVIISNPVLQLQIPNFGQGWMVSSGITWANEWNSRFVLGGGISYLYSAAYHALQGYDAYNPGDELLMTGGMDIRVNPSSTVSFDVIYTIYGKDKFGSEEILAPGNKQVYTLQYRHYFGYDYLQVLARYRTRASNQLIAVQQANKIIPDNIDLLAFFQHRFSSLFSTGIMAQFRHFRSSDAQLSDGTIFTGGIFSAVTLSSVFTLPVQVKFHRGSFRENISLGGFEMSMAIRLSL